MRCSRFGRTVTIQEFYSFYLQNTECSNFYFSLVTTILFTHTHWEEYSQECFIFALRAPEIYIINFILHFERFFIYIYIFSSSFSSLVEIAYKNSERFYTFQNAFTTDIRYTFLHSSNLRRITFLIFRSNVYRKYK